MIHLRAFYDYSQNYMGKCKIFLKHVYLGHFTSKHICDFFEFNNVVSILKVTNSSLRFFSKILKLLIYNLFNLHL